MNIQSFQDWLSESLKKENANPVQTQTAVKQKTSAPKAENITFTPTDRQSMVSDIDAILNSLDVLTKELTEELALTDVEFLEEADNAAKSVWQWLFVAPKAKKAVAKLNKIKMNKMDLQHAADNAPNKEQKVTLANKAKAISDQISNIQKAIDDKYGSETEVVQKAMRTEKLKGEMAIIKRMSGMEDNPNTKKSLAQKLAEVQKNYQEEVAALSELEPSEDDKKKAAAKQKEEEDRLRKEREDIEKNKDDQEAGSNEPKDGSSEPKDGSNEPKDGSNEPKDGSNEPKDGSSDMNQEEIDDFKTKAKERIKKEKPDISDEDLEKQINAELEQEKKKRSNEPNESFSTSISKSVNKTKQQLLERAYLINNKELIAEIENKDDFYFNEGSKVKENIEYRLKIAEFNSIFESTKYTTTDVKSRLKKLL